MSRTRRDSVEKNSIAKRRRVITVIEQLSNEIFYEVFDYLDSSEIFYAFLSLNTRFDRLIKYSSSPIKLTRSASFDDMTQAHYQQLILSNRDRIISFYLNEISHVSYFSLLLAKNELFNRLECVALEKIQYNNLILVLANLRILPRLFSLKIHVETTEHEFGKVYGLIWMLPALKSAKISTNEPHSIFFLPLNIGQSSTLEHLVLAALRDLSDLYRILSSTPRVSHLTCKRLTPNVFNNVDTEVNVRHLRSISLKDGFISFSAFKRLAQKLFSQIETLNLVTTTYQNLFVYPGRWERLILQHIPRLRTFNFKCSTFHNPEHSPPPMHPLTFNRFVSSFWTKRKWFFELQLHSNTPLGIKMNYSIQPIRKQWYELSTTNCSSVVRQKNLDIPILRLHLICEGSDPFFEYYVCSVADSTQFTNLQVDFLEFSIKNLLVYLHHLPKLDSLTITSQLPGREKLVVVEQGQMFRAVSTKNKITKLSIERVTELDQVQLLMTLCPCLHYLQLTCRTTADAEWLIRYVFTKQTEEFIPDLRLICISLSTADELLVNRLRNIIDYEKLVEKYQISRICDRIYLQWNE